MKRLSQTRMAGFDAWYGNVLSERAEHELELTGIIWLFTASRSMEVNTLVSTRYRPEFAHSNILMLGASNPERDAEHRGVASALRVAALGDNELIWGEFSSLLSQG